LSQWTFHNPEHQKVNKMKNGIFPVLFPAVVLLSFSCRNEPAKKEVSTIADTPAVQTILLHGGELTTHMELPGELRPFQAVDLYAKVNSFVKEMYVDIGSPVRKGQLLVRLEAPELADALHASEALFHTQEALYRASKANYTRMYHTSIIPGTIAPNELDMAYAKMGADSANLEAARSRYRESAVQQGYLEVHAPFNGIISSRNIYPGAYAGPAGKGSSLPLLTLQEQARLRLVIAVPEAATPYFRQKDRVYFSVAAIPGRLFTASISRLAGSLDTQLRTEQLEMDVDNTNKVLIPGMFAQVMLDLRNNKNVFIVPKAAVAGNSRQIFVIRLDNGRTVWIPVRKGREDSASVEVFGKLQEGDVLVCPATDELKTGTVVRVVSN